MTACRQGRRLVRFSVPREPESTSQPTLSWACGLSHNASHGPLTCGNVDPGAREAVDSGPMEHSAALVAQIVDKVVEKTRSQKWSKRGARGTRSQRGIHRHRARS
ncbi:hypothetical protein NOCA2220257 [metagenome]|uniref:Uncharacterized protein n=1 Tax=metagenome TaxID=256318 RepID=A0A2P2BZA7_9ZZZZ